MKKTNTIFVNCKLIERNIKWLSNETGIEYTRLTRLTHMDKQELRHKITLNECMQISNVFDKLGMEMEW